MIKDDNNNIDRTAQQIDELAGDIRSLLVEMASEALDLIGVMAQTEHWITPGGEGLPTDPQKLTVRSGRGIRSLGPMGGSFSATGQREAIHEIQISGDTVTAKKGTTVPYLPIHHHGGTIRQTVTEKQRAFFWAMAYQTSDEKFKAMALSTELTIHIPQRPVMPEVSAVKPRIEQLFRNKLEALAHGRL